VRSLVVDLARKFRLLADVINAAHSGKVTVEDIKSSLAASGNIRRAEIEAITRLAKEFGFIEEDQEKELFTSKEGLAFERYISVLNSEIIRSRGIPQIDRGTELKVCITVPPMWLKRINERFGDLIGQTLDGQKLVSEDAKTRLVIVSPFIDVGIMQVALRDIHARGVELIIITSEPTLAKTYPGGKNYKIQKLGALIRSRFKSGKVLFVKHGNSIAHAKVWCSDRSVLITSANIKPDSTTDNLEIGVFTDDPGLVAVVQNFLTQILEMEGVECLLEIPP